MGKNTSTPLLPREQSAPTLTSHSGSSSLAQLSLYEEVWVWHTVSDLAGRPMEVLLVLSNTAASSSALNLPA